MKPRSLNIVVLDHYDSFTYNLVDSVQRLGARCEVWQHDRTTPQAVLAARPDGVLLSPGPGHPAEARCAAALVQDGRLPLLGVCLGQQVLGLALGAQVGRANPLLHGKVCAVQHDGSGLFHGLPSPFLAARYNSLTLLPETLPAALKICARDADGQVMGVSHAHLPLHGVQFHPESALSEYGTELLSNWLKCL